MWCIHGWHREGAAIASQDAKTNNCSGSKLIMLKMRCAPAGRVAGAGGGAGPAGSLSRGRCGRAAGRAEARRQRRQPVGRLRHGRGPPGGPGATCALLAAGGGSCSCACQRPRFCLGCEGQAAAVRRRKAALVPQRVLLPSGAPGGEFQSAPPSFRVPDRALQDTICVVGCRSCRGWSRRCSGAWRGRRCCRAWAPSWAPPPSGPWRAWRRAAAPSPPSPPSACPARLGSGS